MKKTKLLLPLLGITTTAGAVVPLAVSCNKDNTEEYTVSVDSTSNVEINVTKVKKGEGLEAIVTPKTGYKIVDSSCKVTVGTTELDASKVKFTPDNATAKAYKLTVAKEDINGNIVVKVDTVKVGYAVELNNLTPDTTIKNVKADKLEITQEEAKTGLKIIVSSETDSALVYVTQLAIGNTVLEYDNVSEGEAVADGKWKFAEDEIVFSNTSKILIGKGAVNGDLTITYGAYSVYDKAFQVFGYSVDGEETPLAADDYGYDKSIVKNWDGKITITLNSTETTKGTHIDTSKTQVSLVTPGSSPVDLKSEITQSLDNNVLTITFSQYAQFLITSWYERDIRIVFYTTAD